MRLAALALLILGSIPVLIAAPVPESARPAFGSGGLVTLADLERLQFESLTARDDEPHSRLNLDPSSIGLAVHVPGGRFISGESIPAYFVLRNAGQSNLGLDMRLDLASGEPAIWNSARITVRNRSSGKPVHIISRAGWRCGGPPLVVVPAGGYYCARGELGRSTEGATLPPGEYEVEWSYAEVRSRACRFTVLPGNDSVKAPAKRDPVITFFFWLSNGDREELAKQTGTVTWKKLRMDPVETGGMAAALAVGRGDKYVPDVRAIPASDGMLKVSAVWTSDGDGDRVAIMLRAADEKRPVAFDQVPQLHLHVEKEAAGRLHSHERLREVVKDALHTAALRTPITLNLHLPKDWREAPELTGKCRVAILVTSQDVELPRDARIKKLKRDKVLQLPGNPPIWSGIVRTGFTELAATKS